MKTASEMKDCIGWVVKLYCYSYSSVLLLYLLMIQEWSDLWSWPSVNMLVTIECT